MSVLIRYDFNEGLNDLSGNEYDALGTLDFCHDEWVRCVINSKNAASFFKDDTFSVKFKLTHLVTLDKPQLICSNYSNANFLNWAFYYEEEQLHIVVYGRFLKITLDKNIKELEVELTKKDHGIIVTVNGDRHIFRKPENKAEDKYTLYIDVGYSSYDIVKMFDSKPLKGRIEYLEIYNKKEV